MTGSWGYEAQGSPYLSRSQLESPLPIPRAGLATAIGRWFRKGATFAGRASRSEYWWTALVNAVVYAFCAALAVIVQLLTAETDYYGQRSDAPTGWTGLVVLVILVYAGLTLLPNLALTVRRLHDAGLSGWLVLIGLVPLVGGLGLLVLVLLPSRPIGDTDHPGSTQIGSDRARW